jgi:uncharacterized damage-inducible protein DinB
MLDSIARTPKLPRPTPSEHDPYYQRYVDLVPDGDILLTLRHQLANTLQLLEDLPEDRETFRYAEGKWSLREVLGHLIDVERLFEFRALAMARQDGVDLPGMDQDVWAAHGRANERRIPDLTEEWKTVRRGAIHLFATFDEAAGARTGRASGRSFTVRTFPWLIAGHELWHRKIIEERYLEG